MGLRPYINGESISIIDGLIKGTIEGDYYKSGGQGGETKILVEGVGCILEINYSESLDRSFLQKLSMFSSG